MLNQKPLDQLIFLDIESTSQCPDYMGIQNTKIKQLFYKKFEKDIDEMSKIKALPEYDGAKISSIEDIYNQKAPLYAEFGKVIAISIGILTMIPNEDPKAAIKYKLQTLNLADIDEKKLLQDFLSKVTKICTPKKINEITHSIVAYNGLIFDIPFLSKRLILNGFDIPCALDIAGKKPWDISWIIDPKDHWKFGVWDGNVSLDLLCASFGIESSKDDMDGSMVKDAFWKDKDIKKISTYCEKDIFALAKVYLKMQNNNSEIIK